MLILFSEVQLPTLKIVKLLLFTQKYYHRTKTAILPSTDMLPPLPLRKVTLTVMYLTIATLQAPVPITVFIWADHGVTMPRQFF